MALVYPPWVSILLNTQQRMVFLTCFIIVYCKWGLVPLQICPWIICHMVGETWLFYTFDLPPSTKIINLIKQIATVMESSDSNYLFASAHCSITWHKTVPLLLLKFNNRGLPRSQDQQIWLCCAVFENEATITNLLCDCTQFTNPNLAINGNQWFVICFGVSFPNLGHPTWYSFAI